MNVFGTVNDQTIYLPSTPYQIRLNCKDGGIFVGGQEQEFRRTNPKDKVPVTIIKVAKFFGDLGKTKDALWWQLFFVPSPKVDSKILPSNTVCVAYIKKQSISALNNLATEIISNQKIDPAQGIFEISFAPHAGKDGTYYSVNFEWRERQKDEVPQLKLIQEFWEVCKDDLIDLDGTRDMRNIAMLSPAQLQQLLADSKDEQEQEQKQLAGK